MKRFKKIMALVLTTVSAVGIMSAAVSANFVSNSYASFEWNNNYCTIKNTTNTERRMEASFMVYEMNTGDRIDSSNKVAVGAYGTTATARNPKTHSSNYNYRWIGVMYNGNHPYSGVASSFSKP